MLLSVWPGAILWLIAMEISRIRKHVVGLDYHHRFTFLWSLLLQCNGGSVKPGGMGGSRPSAVLESPVMGGLRLLGEGEV